MSSKIDSDSYNWSQSSKAPSLSQAPALKSITSQKLYKAIDRSAQLSGPKKILCALSIIAGIVAIGALLAAYFLQGGSNPLAFQATLYTGMAAGGILTLLFPSFSIVSVLKKRADDVVNGIDSKQLATLGTDDQATLLDKLKPKHVRALLQCPHLDNNKLKLAIAENLRAQASAGSAGLFLFQKGCDLNRELNDNARLKKTLADNPEHILKHLMFLSEERVDMLRSKNKANVAEKAESFLASIDTSDTRSAIDIYTEVAQRFGEINHPLLVQGRYADLANDIESWNPIFIAASSKELRIIFNNLNTIATESEELQIKIKDMKRAIGEAYQRDFGIQIDFDREPDFQILPDIEKN